MRTGRRLIFIFSTIAVLVVLLSRCMDSAKKIPVTETTIAGAQTCKRCHADVFESYYDHNPHTITSSLVTGTKVMDGPLPASDTFSFNTHLKLVVEKRKGAMYQVAYVDGKETMARRFDVKIGSGKDAHTYGSWEGNKLTQLPLSYFKAVNSWANSPGFPNNKAYFSRAIGTRCLECHASFADRTLVQTGALTVSEELDKKSIVYGIDCERCHGPAGKHVEFHLEHPEEKQAKFIARYKSLSRKQKADACAICHSGNDLEVVKSTFAFKPGDDVADYYENPTFSRTEPDVHGNQSRMLAESKCFIKSNMECSTCHNIHNNSRAGLTLYSKKCISCHQTIKHSGKTLKNAMVKTNCIDCHMPLQSSKLISYQLAGKSKVNPYLLHTHRIAVY